MTPITSRISREITEMEIQRDLYLENDTSEEEYVNEIRQLAINLLLAIDGKIKLDNYIPALDIDYRVKRGN